MSTAPSSDVDATSASPERWLYAGEDVLVTEPVKTGWVAVTTHRLLVYTPDSDGRAFVSYDRPNVGGVRFDSSGNERSLAVLPRLFVYGLVSLGGGVAFSRAGLADLLAVDAGDSLAVVGMAGLFDTLRVGLQLLELALFGVGALTLLCAVAVALFYAHSRTTTLVVDVVGDGAIRQPLPDGTVDDVSLERVRSALAQR
ncbi:hypothetical protein [Halogranum rubrum]|uniref:hypothetical protein n=1 Tax=Halogranum rubrum TaxID=553466 RepID=UPI0012F9925C|nr:hypothetical protein [Halogranum salarium]